MDIIKKIEYDIKNKINYLANNNPELFEILQNEILLNDELFETVYSLFHNITIRVLA